MTRLKVFGEADRATIDQIKRCSEEVGAPAAVLCADNHLGYSMPIGGVVGYPEHVSPSGVGYDIACGNKAVKTNITANDIGHQIGPDHTDLELIANEIEQRISFGMGRKNKEPVDHPVIDSIRNASMPEQRSMLDLAAQQLGTVGAGNHYVDLFVDEDDAIWVGVHFGSRGFGHKTATGFLNLANGLDFAGKGAGDGMDAPPTLIPTDSDLGQAYIEAMELAGQYAYAGRDLVCDKVLEILGAEAIDEVHNHHNFAWHEVHDGQKLWVVRKGATPAWPDQRGFVGGSMGDISVILKGVDGKEALEALYSTVHGAGRAMSRTKAAGKYAKNVYECMDRDCKRTFKIEGVSSHNGPPKKGVCPDHPDARVKKVRRRMRTGGAINWNETLDDLKRKGIILRGGAADEAPGAYKNIGDVLSAHSNSIEIETILKPIVVVMAGEHEYDAFKD